MGFMRSIEDSGQNGEGKEEGKLPVLVDLLLERSLLAARGRNWFLADLGNYNL